MKWLNTWVATSASPTHPDRNEDSYWVAASERAAAVIDGMGGYRRRTADGEVGGEHASSLAAQLLAEHLDRWEENVPLEDARVRLRVAVEAVNRGIWEQLNWSGEIPESENPEGKSLDELTVGVALTLVALCDGGQRALLAQHGDTRGYVLKEQLGLIQLTEDQDLLMWERSSGLISEEDAAAVNEMIDHFDGVNVPEGFDQQVMRYFFDRNIFGALGVEAECPESGWSVIKLAPGDRLALLSDGAHSNMSVDELQDLLAYPEDPATVVVELAQQRSLLPRSHDPTDPYKPFNLRATQDDMTAVIVEVGERQ
ncbi:MAG: protein phosphatase 2C domain-containing protein [Chloroflexota bacterium]|nr:protein phosphatase 2C domain-containing protein [Chloroflexota bacterium]